MSGWTYANGNVVFSEVCHTPQLSVTVWAGYASIKVKFWFIESNTANAVIPAFEGW